MTNFDFSSRTLAARRRGSAYLLVLGVTSLVAVIGISALLAVRLQHAGVNDRADAVQARQSADAALRIVHARLAADPAWRSGFTHDVWSPAEPLAGDSFTFKLVDEDDGDLANDDDPARLVARAVSGHAVRLASVEVTSNLDAGSGGDAAMIDNGDAEAGLSPFIGYPSGNADVELSTESPHDGNQMLGVKNRDSTDAGLAVDVSDSIALSATYRVSAWVRVPAGSATVRVGFRLNELLSSRHVYVSKPVGAVWTEVVGDVTTPALSLLPSSSYFLISTASGTRELQVDDISVTRIEDPDDAAPRIVAGSYRRDLDE